MLHASGIESNKKEVILSLKNLKVKFLKEEEEIKVIDRVNLDLFKGETMAMIGESGSGKSVLGLTIIRLLPTNTIISGQIIYKGRDLLSLEQSSLKNVRGKEIAWIPQMAGTALNPTLRIGLQVGEIPMDHFGLNKSRAWESAVNLLKWFDVNPAGEIAKSYPHQLSGGMKQRVLVATGIAGMPNLLIADEPTKGLDINRKTLVLNIFNKAKKLKPDLTILLITHDLEFAERIADRVAVMYCGQIIEVTEANKFFKSPLHPYSQLLLKSLPSKGLIPILGRPANVANPPPGCRFHPRCPYAISRCRDDEPPAISIGGNIVKCWRAPAP